MGEHFPKPESEIRFGWGISYNYIGQLHHNLNKYDVVVGLEIPDFRTVTYYTQISTDPQYCKKWYDRYNDNTKVLYETCTQVWPAYLATINKLEHSKERIKLIMEKEIPAVVPNFRLRQPEFTTTLYPDIVCNLQDETIMDLDDDQPTCVVQPTPLEVIVTDHPQTTVTFNEEQISVHSNVPESESESD